MPPAWLMTASRAASLVVRWRRASHWSRGGGTHGDATHEGCSQLTPHVLTLQCTVWLWLYDCMQRGSVACCSKFSALSALNFFYVPILQNKKEYQFWNLQVSPIPKMVLNIIFQTRNIFEKKYLKVPTKNHIATGVFMFLFLLHFTSLHFISLYMYFTVLMYYVLFH